METKPPLPVKSIDQSSSQRDPKNVDFLSTGDARIGLVINGFRSDYYGRMLDGACEYLLSSGYVPIVQPSYATPNGEYKAIHNLLECGCRGIIFQCDALSDTKLKQLMEQYKELALLNRVIDGYEHRCVYVDNALGVKQVARHLLDNGHTNVAMITGPRNKIIEVHTRTNEFVSSFKEQGYDIPLDLIVESDFTFDGGARSFRKLLGTHLPFTAVFAQNDGMAMGILEVCRQKGLRVPDDLSVVGFDDHDFINKVSIPSLTTVRQPAETIGKRAAELINELVAGSESVAALPPSYGRIVPELVERDTVALLAAPELKKDHELAKSLTSREVECLHWMAAGKTSGEIAIILAISESTVNFHLKNTLTKLNSNNRVQAVAKAVYGGIISP